MFNVCCVLWQQGLSCFLGFWLWEGKGCIYLDLLLHLPNVIFAENVMLWIPAQKVSEWLVHTGQAEKCPGLGLSSVQSLHPAAVALETHVERKEIRQLVTVKWKSEETGVLKEGLGMEMCHMAETIRTVLCNKQACVCGQGQNLLNSNKFTEHIGLIHCNLPNSSDGNPSLF